jgi:acetyltransferase-like isoleucine patch superfamily enzyme
MKAILKRILPRKLIDTIKTTLYFLGMTSKFPKVYCIRKNGKRLFLSNYLDVTNWSTLTIGNNVFIWHFTILDTHNGITIGDDCQIGTRVGIFTHSSHNSIRYYNKEYHNTNCFNHKGRIRGSVTIGRNTFVGANSIIMPNTKIGEGCIVSGFSYVQGDFDDFSIIAGNPAKKIGDTRRVDYRFLKSNPELEMAYLDYFGIANLKSVKEFQNE